MRFAFFRAAAVPLLCLTAGSAGAQQLATTLVASGFSAPTFVTSPPGDASRLFVVEQAGRIRIVANGQVLATPFLDIDPKVQSGGEQGLFSMAFHPAYPADPRFWVSYTGNGGPSILEQYVVSANPDVADAASGTIVYGPLPQPQANHNGGQIQFGPDGFLYFGLGDGGGANDSGTGHAPGGNAQSPTTDLGKMLRIDVDNPSTAPASNPFATPTDGVNDLIWAFGLRNPWRFSFDRATGDLWIGDVGQGAWEEVDFQPASSAGGENYGWRCMEGAHCTGLTGCTCNDPALVLPVHEYSHASGCSITGGYVYRGSAIPGLGGTYFFADYCSARIWSFRYVNGQVTEFVERTADLDPPGALAIGNVSSFGQDADGELYVVDQGGEIYRIEGECPAPTPYCVAAPNSTGVGGAILARGSTSLAADDFRVGAQNLPPGSNALLLAGSGPAQSPLANGFLCLAPPIQRLGVTSAGPAGNLVAPVTWARVPGAAPGASVFFQLYYRDPAAGGANANLTDALEVIVCP